MKKLAKIILLFITVFIIIKTFIFLTEIITHKKEIEKVNDINDQVNETQALSFIKTVEEYCELEMIKGRPAPERITDPNEILFHGESPKSVDLILTNECKAKGTLVYRNQTYEYDYETEKLTIQ